MKKDFVGFLWFPGNEDVFSGVGKLERRGGEKKRRENIRKKGFVHGGGGGN